MKPIFVIEHLESELGRWLFYEYAHASKIVGKERLLFTNVKVKKEALKLKKLGGVEERTAADIFTPDKVIILDPRAEHPLKPDDFWSIEAIIIGGILGDHPPKGRTFSLITSRFLSAAARNIGRYQFSIDGAVYVAKLVSQGIRLEQIPIKRGLRIRLNDYAEVYLPYAYPLQDGQPVISRKLISYLRSEQIVRDEEELIKS
ncbi:MAG: SAM-dependent methyltransferase [Candidatus Bathyarchaeia archaeon]